MAMGPAEVLGGMQGTLRGNRYAGVAVLVVAGGSRIAA